MKKQNTIAATDKSKVIILNILFFTAIVIIFSGIFFSIFSLVNNIHFIIFNSSISGAVFGLLVLYLGIKYYFSVIKLKDDLFKASSKFSWTNFKKSKKHTHKKRQ